MDLILDYNNIDFDNIGLLIPTYFMSYSKEIGIYYGITNDDLGNVEDNLKKTIIKTPLMNIIKGLQRIGDRTVISLSQESIVRMQNEKYIKLFRKTLNNCDHQLKTLIDEKKQKWRMQNSMFKPTLSRQSEEYPEYFNLEVSDATDIFTEDGLGDLNSLQPGCYVMAIIELSHISIYSAFHQPVWIAHQISIIKPISPSKRKLGSTNLISFYDTKPEKKTVKIETPPDHRPIPPPPPMRNIPPPPPQQLPKDQPLKFTPSVSDLLNMKSKLNKIVPRESPTCDTTNIDDSDSDTVIKTHKKKKKKKEK